MNTRILCCLAALATLLGTATASTSADVWRWVDSTGRVHYSDVPVEGAVRVKAAVPRPAGAAPAGNAAGSGAPSAGAAPTLANQGVAINEKLQGEAATRAVQDDLAKKRAEQCKEATERYDRSIAARRLYRDGKNGERIWLTDAEIEQARVEARRDRDAVCNPGATPR
jgi:hypothetical protein